MPPAQPNAAIGARQGRRQKIARRLLVEGLSLMARRVCLLGLGRSDSESLLAGVGTVHLRYFQVRPEVASLLTQTCGLDQDSPAGQS